MHSDEWVSPEFLRELYRKGVNVSQWLRDHHASVNNDESIVELAYDIQAGSYVAALEDSLFRQHKEDYGRAIAREVLSLTTPLSILEAGVGEATTLLPVAKALPTSIALYGFDLAWSRVHVARDWLTKNGYCARLCCASLLRIPAVDDAFDVVFTSHAVEPNRGREAEIVRELFRVCRRYLILLEPAYELAEADARVRMDLHRYCRGLPEVARSFGYRVLDHRVFAHSANPLNPTAITIIEKNPAADQSLPDWMCPASRAPLRRIDDFLYSDDAGLAYPVLQGIPCLRVDKGIIASTLETN